MSISINFQSPKATIYPNCCNSTELSNLLHHTVFTYVLQFSL